MEQSQFPLAAGAASLGLLLGGHGAGVLVGMALDLGLPPLRRIRDLPAVA